MSRNRSRRRRSGAKHPASEWLSLLPIVPLLLLLTAGVGYTAAQAMSTEGAFQAAFGLPGIGRTMLFSLAVAAGSASVSVALGTVLAYLLWRLPAVYRRWGSALALPLILPHVVVGFLTLVWFGQSGLVSAAFERIGLHGVYRSPLFRGDGVGIVLAYVYKSAPFVLFLVLPVLRRIDPAYLQTARMLGAGELRSFASVLLPRLVPAAGAAWIILFVYSFGAYDLPFMVGESSPRMISLYLYRIYFARPISERPTAAALLFVVFLVGVVMVVAYTRAASGTEERERRL